MGLSFLIASIVLQATAACLAVQLALRQRRAGWIFVAAAVSLMVARRCFTLFRYQLLDTPLDPVAEFIALMISAFTAGGLGLLVQRQEAASPPETEEPSQMELASLARHKQHAMVLSGLSFLGISVLIYFSYVSSREAVIERISKGSLDLAHMLESSASAPGGPTNDLLARLESLWTTAHSQYPDNYLCVIGSDGRLRLNTLHPGDAGMDLSQIRVPWTVEPETATVLGLIHARQDWAGQNEDPKGQAQIAAYAYSEALDGLISVQLPAAGVEKEIRAAVLPWTLGFAGILLVIFPLSVGLLYQVGSSSQRAAFSALRKQRQSDFVYRTLVEQASDGIFIADREFRFAEVNTRGCGMLGYTREEMRRRVFQQLLAEEEIPRAERELTKLLAGQAVQSEWRFRRKDGSFFHGEVSACLLPDGQIQGILRDTSERKRAEEALHESEQRYRMLTEAAIVGVFVHQDGLLRYANPALARMLGFERPDQLVGRRYWEEFVPPEFHEELQARTWQCLRGERLSVHPGWQCLRKDGSRLWVQSSGTVMEWEGRPAILAFLEDITERKLATQALLERESRLRAIIETEPECVKVVGTDGKLLDMNPAGLAMLEARTLSEVQQHTLLSFVLPEHRAAFGDLHERVIAGESGKMVFEVTGIRGKRRWLETHAVPLRNAAGAVHALLGITRDISERKRAEDELRKSEASLALAQRVAHIGSWDVDLARGKLQWSDETFRIFGLSRETFAPTSEAFFKMVHPEDRERVRAAAQASVRSGQAYCIDHRIVRPDGSVRVVQERADIFPDADRKSVRMVGTVQDITELKEAKEALQRSERHFRSLIEHAHDLITILDAEGAIRFQSPSSRVTLGYAPEALLHRSVFDLVHPADAPLIRAALERALQGPETPSSVVFRLRHADGTWRTLESIGKHLKGELGAQVVVNSRDITDRLRLEEQFRQAQKMEAIGQLAGGVAHDFNNLLTVIQGNASMLIRKSGASETVLEHAPQIIQASERAANLTRQLLTFGRKQMLQPDDLDLNEVVGNMTRMLQHILGEDVALRSEFSPNLPLIHADAGMMEQVILNLAVNARDAMPDGGRLTIQTSSGSIDEASQRENPEAALGRYVCVTVSDTGRGISREILPRIFEPFFTTKEVGKGTGLGLATVYGIVKQHQGWIKVESEPGRGAVFRIFLPATDRPKTPSPEKNPSSQLPSGTETVLVVEDEPEVRMLVTELLSQCGYRVLAAETGVAALRIWREAKDGIDLVLTDMVMPDGLTGRELAAQLQAENPQLKILFTSGYSADVVGKELVLKEGSNYLQKPFRPLNLAQTIRNCLDAD